MQSRKCVLKDLNGKSKNKNETMHWELSWKRVTMLLRLQQNGYSEVVRYLGGGKASLPLFLSKYINIYT